MTISSPWWKKHGITTGRCFTTLPEMHSIQVTRPSGKQTALFLFRAGRTWPPVGKLVTDLLLLAYESGRCQQLAAVAAVKAY